uniref:Uncharacterized protein n=1 Tax=Aegilops tauschii subsp. strangulata TaxID=200361 RepID=A0A453CE54_AEGTS
MLARFRSKVIQILICKLFCPARKALMRPENLAHKGSILPFLEPHSSPRRSASPASPAPRPSGPTASRAAAFFPGRLPRRSWCSSGHCSRLVKLACLTCYG